MNNLEITYPTLQLHTATLTITNQQAKALVHMNQKEHDEFVLDQLKTLWKEGHPIPHLSSWGLSTIRLSWSVSY